MSKIEENNSLAGLTLVGAFVACEVSTGVARDDKNKTFRTRKSVITTGKKVFFHTEYIDDLTEETEEFPVKYQNCRIDVAHAKSEGGQTTVFGDLIFTDAKDTNKSD